ncbi:hypothetical protein NDU88_007502 [Pleurodeles waltl]|uniref:Uncharacterized protein n=1 Tax=Pleurodeles waltl TaxID=8319 RepID=A0AAV7VSI4_PLEWA|nr:hypothetical protein NDU88_007502 [Pleurodeles waltl]
MGTHRASMTRFPVSREKLEDFRGSDGEKGPEPKDAERESATRSGRDEGVKEVKSGRTGVEERDEEDERAAGSPLAHGRSDQIRLSDLIGCPIQRYGAADVSVSGDMSADTRCHPHPILSVKSGRMETLFSIRPGWGSDWMGSDESGQAVRSHPIPHRERRGSDISLSAHSAETELSSAGSAGISGSIPAEQRTVRNVFVCH